MTSSYFLASRRLLTSVSSVLIARPGPRGTLACGQPNSIGEAPASTKLVKAIRRAAVSNAKDAQIWKDFTNRALPILPLMSTESVVSILYSYGRIGYRDQKLLKEMSSIVLKHMGRLSTKGLVLALCGFRKLEYKSVDTVELLVNQLMLYYHRRELGVLDLALIANALTFFEVPHPQFWSELEKRLKQIHVPDTSTGAHDEINGTSLTLMFSAYNKIRVRSSSAMDVLTNVFLAKASTPEWFGGANNIANCVYALSSLGVKNRELAESCLNLVMTVRGEMDLQAVSQCIFSIATGLYGARGGPLSPAEAHRSLVLLLEAYLARAGKSYVNLSEIPVDHVRRIVLAASVVKYSGAASRCNDGERGIESDIPENVSKFLELCSNRAKGMQVRRFISTANTRSELTGAAQVSGEHKASEDDSSDLVSESECSQTAEVDSGYLGTESLRSKASASKRSSSPEGAGSNSIFDKPPKLSRWAREVKAVLQDEFKLRARAVRSFCDPYVAVIRVSGKPLQGKSDEVQAKADELQTRADEVQTRADPVESEINDSVSDALRSTPPHSSQGRSVLVLPLGPFHYFAGTSERTPVSLTVERIAKLTGYPVVPVPYFHWNELKTTAMKVQYLVGAGRIAREGIDRDAERLQRLTRVDSPGTSPSVKSPTSRQGRHDGSKTAQLKSTKSTSTGARSLTTDSQRFDEPLPSEQEMEMIVQKSLSPRVRSENLRSPRIYR